MTFDNLLLPEPDAKILDLQRLLLIDFLDRDNLAGSLLELPELPEEVPKPGLRHNLVRCEDSHAVQWSLRLILGRKLAPDDAKLAQRSGGPHFIGPKFEKDLRTEKVVIGKGRKTAMIFCFSSTRFRENKVT